MPLKAQVTVNGEKSILAAGVAVTYGEGYGHCISHDAVSVPRKWFKRFIFSMQLPQSFCGVSSGVM